MFITMYKGNEKDKKKFEKFFDVFITIAKKYSTPEMHEMVGSTHWLKTDIDKNPGMESAIRDRSEIVSYPYIYVINQSGHSRIINYEMLPKDKFQDSVEELEMKIKQILMPYWTVKSCGEFYKI